MNVGRAGVRRWPQLLALFALLMGLAVPATAAYAGTVTNSMSATTSSTSVIDVAWNLSGTGTSTSTLKRCAGIGCEPSSIVSSAESPSGTYHDTAVTPGVTYHYLANGSNGFLQVYGGAPVIASVTPNAGGAAGGTSVTLTGYALGNAGTPTVSFGVSAATGVSSTLAAGVGGDNFPYQIGATSPAHAAGTVHVTVTTNGGTSATNENDQFTYAAGQPVVTGLSPASGRPAGDTSVTITGSGFSGATAVAFGAEAASSFIVNSDTSITAVSPGGVGRVDVKVTTSGGTSAVSAGDQFLYSTPMAVVGKAGTTFKLSGANFGTTTPSVVFTPVGDGSPTTVSATCVAKQTQGCIQKNNDKSISVKAPSGPSGLQSVSVTGVGNGYASLYFDYGPAILKLGKAAGGTGTTIKISGGNFGTSKTSLPTVRFGTNAISIKCDSSHKSACIASSSDKSISVKAPEGTASQAVTVTTAAGVQADDLTSVGAQFAYSGAITIVSPQGGTAGTSVKIKGQGFGKTAPTVTFGDTTLSATCASKTSHGCIKSSNDTSITVIAPDGLTGVQDIGVTTANGDADDQTPAGAVFTYGPAVTSVSPLTGPAAKTTITIKGANLGKALPQVTIGSSVINAKCGKAVAAPCIVSNNASQIKVKPPTSLSGAQPITVTVGGIDAENLTAAPLEFNFGADITGVK